MKKYTHITKNTSQNTIRGPHKDQFCWFRYHNNAGIEIKIYNQCNHPVPMSIVINNEKWDQVLTIEPLYLPGYELVIGDLFFRPMTKPEAEGVAQIRLDAYEKLQEKEGKRLKRNFKRQYFEAYVKEYINKPIVTEKKLAPVSTDEKKV